MKRQTLRFQSEWKPTEFDCRASIFLSTDKTSFREMEKDILDDILEGQYDRRIRPAGANGSGSSFLFNQIWWNRIICELIRINWPLSFSLARWRHSGQHQRHVPRYIRHQWQQNGNISHPINAPWYPPLISTAWFQFLHCQCRNTALFWHFAKNGSTTVWSMTACRVSVPIHTINRSNYTETSSNIPIQLRMSHHQLSNASCSKEMITKKKKF